MVKMCNGVPLVIPTSGCYCCCCCFYFCCYNDIIITIIGVVVAEQNYDLSPDKLREVLR